MKTIIGSVTTDDDGNEGVAIDRHRPCGGKRTSRKLLISEGSRRRYGHRPTAGAAAAVNDDDDSLDDNGDSSGGGDGGDGNKDPEVSMEEEEPSKDKGEDPIEATGRSALRTGRLSPAGKTSGKKVTGSAKPPHDHKFKQETNIEASSRVQEVEEYQETPEMATMMEEYHDEFAQNSDGDVVERGDDSRLQSDDEENIYDLDRTCKGTRPRWGE